MPLFHCSIVHSRPRPHLTLEIFLKKKFFFQFFNFQFRILPGKLRHSRCLCWIASPIVGISQKNWPGFPLPGDYCPVQSANAEIKICWFPLQQSVMRRSSLMWNALVLTCDENEELTNGRLYDIYCEIYRDY